MDLHRESFNSIVDYQDDLVDLIHELLRNFQFYSRLSPLTN
ncbi:hypothetical protein J5U22_01691 [Saccharolobus shibatae]|uniref:Uncharacterized protein n=1 Tax=Saccharolobus shibatae TaxID=2286 RepID=A0A8F5GZB7_9CREN|nr:hypothetical protein J5U22_01691 [Saccharolobus shibatae]